MNKWNQLLAMLDQVFGFKNKIRSNFRKVSQDFDEKTNEHVILIECRVRVKGTMKSAPRKGQQVIAARPQLAGQRRTWAEAQSRLSGRSALSVASARRSVEGPACVKTHRGKS